MPEAPLPDDDPVHLPRLLADLGLVPSSSEGRGLIGQGGLRIDGEVVSELDAPRERPTEPFCRPASEGSSG